MTSARHGPRLLAAFLAVHASLAAQEPQQQALSYSVQIAALSSAAGANALVQRWTSPETPYYVVPVEVNGQLYHRVLAGLLPSRTQAVALMNNLVARGIKDSAADWHVRDAGLAFELGSYASEAASLRSVERAAADGIPTYRILTTSSDGLRHKVFSGGFSRPAEASHLRGRLEAVGFPTDLGRRAGILPGETAQVLATAAAVREEAAEAPPIPADEPEQVVAPPDEVPEPPDEETEPPVDEADPVAEVPVEDRPPSPEPRERVAAPQPAEAAPTVTQMPTGAGAGWTLGLAAAGGASPGVGEYHLFGGGLVHPRMGRFGLLLSGMYGTGAGYESLAGFGALSVLLVEVSGIGLSALGGFGYYQETALGLDRSLGVTIGGAMVTIPLGPAEVLGAFTAMFGTFEEAGASIDLELFRVSAGLGFRVGGGR